VIVLPIGTLLTKRRLLLALSGHGGGHSILHCEWLLLGVKRTSFTLTYRSIL
jgi:hypothetical protein